MVLRHRQIFGWVSHALADSRLRDGGGDTIVYTRDNSWYTGTVFVHDLKTDKAKSFDARNGHIELDVSFRERRIALTGTSTI